MNFCVAILLLKVEEKKQQFWHIMLYYFKKDKNAIKTQKKRFVQYMEKVLWLIECVKSGLRSFELEISHWTMLYHWVDQLKLIAIKSRHWENQRYTTREIANILKISESSTENHLHQLGYVHRFDVWVPRKLSEKTFSTIFPHVILYGKVDTVQ